MLFGVYRSCKRENRSCKRENKMAKIGPKPCKTKEMNGLFQAMHT
jgi:hypothetical protein